MRYLLFLLFATTLSAQTIGGAGVINGKTVLGSIGQRYVSNIIGLNEFNNQFAESTNTIDAMRFVYSQFEQQAPMTNPAADPCSVIYNGKIYVVAGYGANAGVALNYVQIYNPNTDSWTQGATKTTSVWGPACALYNGKIYTFGGTNSGGTAQTAAEVYDIAGNSWSNLTSLGSTQPNGMMAVTVGSYIYLLYESTFLKFDPSAAAGLGSYATLTAPPSPGQVQWAATGYVNVSGDDRIYFIGGSTGPNTGYTNANYYYSVTNSTWSSAQATAPYSAHGQLQNSVYNGVIYFIGGYDGGADRFYQTLYSYTPATNTWSSAIAQMNSWRDGISGGFIGNILYVVAGRAAANGSTPFGLTANESYQLGASPILQTFTKLQLNYNQGSPTGSVRLGIYTDSSGVPGTLILDAGSVSIVNGWAVISGLSVSSLSLGSYYWLAFVQNAAEAVSYIGGQPAQSVGTDGHCYGSLTFGALPGTFPTPTCISTSMYAEKLTVN